MFFKNNKFLKEENFIFSRRY